VPAVLPALALLVQALAEAEAELAPLFYRILQILE
jgi:hypothetical protein